MTCVLGHRKLAATTLVSVIAAYACASVLLPDTYSTPAGEWRTVTFKDGSLARLGPRTKIAAEFDAKRRWIRQLRGEATYQVAKDPNRPFYVECGVTTVQATGTKFGVTCDSQGSNVTVAEGSVAVFRGLVRAEQVSRADHVRADAGQRVLLDRWTPLAPRPVDVDTALAWERGQIFFPGTPIEQAIGEFNRRHEQQIPIPNDPGRINLLVFGWCDLDDRDRFLECLDMEPKRTTK